MVGEFTLPFLDMMHVCVGFRVCQRNLSRFIVCVKRLSHGSLFHKKKTLMRIQKKKKQRQNYLESTYFISPATALFDQAG